MDAVHSRRHRQQRRNEIVNAVRHQVKCGDLSLGEKLLEELGESSHTVGVLADTIALKRKEIDASLQRAEAAMDRESPEDAIRELVNIRRSQPNNPRLCELSSRLIKGLVAATRQHIEEGRLDLARNQLERLKPLASDHVDVVELEGALHDFDRAALRVDQGDLHAACQTLVRIARVLPAARWIQPAIDHARQAATAVDAMNAGPLGLIGSAPRRTDDQQRPPQPRSPSPMRHYDIHSTLPSRFLIQIDGGGSFLVVRRDTVTLGPVSSSGRPDIGLLIPANLPVTTIHRADEDYFLRSGGTTRINDRKVSEKLLSDGDKIALGPRCSMKFRLPNAASTTAVLDLSGSRLPRPDTHKVVLMHDTMILGSGSSSHIAVPELPTKFVMFLRDGQLHWREAASSDNGRVAGPPNSISMGRPVALGPVSLVLTPADDEI